MMPNFSFARRLAKGFALLRVGCFFTRLFAISAVLASLTVSVQLCDAQTAEPGQAVVCENIQNQVNQLLAISQSSSLTQEEKIAQLSKSWGESLAAMSQFAGKDGDNSKLVTEMITPITAIIASAFKSSSTEGNVSPETKQDLDKVGQLIAPYIGIMKKMCPNLVLPSSVPQ
jgi:hypothetical protein